MPYTTLISPEDLLPYLKDPKWAVVDCRFDLFEPAKGEQDYLRSHIPGAVYAHLERDLSALPTGTNGRHPLPATDDLISTFTKWGIGESVQVVAYDDRGGGFAARLWWCLRYMGHESVAVLDGGFPSWERAGFPTRSGKEIRSPVNFKSQERDAMLVDLDQMISIVGATDALILDARAPERFRGDEEPIDPIAGHIPGAMNRFWDLNLNEDDRFHPAMVLKAEYEDVLGIASPQSVIVYCGSGVTSCHNLLAMTHAGLHGARLYLGSWSEWCADQARPIEIGTGSQPAKS
jgi:thiosulfate/3-mercaptopyruvate sulfurtransferase